MTQVSYGTITITDTNDIESIVVEYNNNQSTTTPPAHDDSGWSTNRPAWAQGYYIWQRTRIHKSGTDESSDTFGDAVCLTGSTGQKGDALGISSVKYAISEENSFVDEEPYIFRSSLGGNRLRDKIVGGSVAWNQLVGNGNFATKSGYSLGNGVNSWDVADNVATINAKASTDNTFIYKSQFPYISGHKYLICVDVKENGEHVAGASGYFYGGAAFTAKWKTIQSGWNTIATIISSLYTGAGTLQAGIRNLSTTGTFTYFMRNYVAFDLTQMFGSTIADYIYSLEQATAGAGVAWFKKYFPKPYYAYNAGELKSVSGLVSHDMTGFNQWDEVWEVGDINSTNGINQNGSFVRSKNYIPAIAGAEYFWKGPSGALGRVFYYDEGKNFISYGTTSASKFITPSGCRYIRFRMGTSYGTTYNHDICINLAWDNSRNGEYEPYELHSYPLDSDLTLRGIPKLDANNKLYYDGDTYESDGTVTRGWIENTITVTTMYRPQSNENYDWAVAQLSDAWDRIGKNMIGEKILQNLNNLPYTSQSIPLGTLLVYNTNTREIAITVTKGTTKEQAENVYNGSKIIYKLATPTTETTDPYTNPQIVNDFGTEEYITDSLLPVGHSTEYFTGTTDQPADSDFTYNEPPNVKDGQWLWVRTTYSDNTKVYLKTRQGVEGLPGTAGRGITDVETLYATNNSTTTAPTSGWQTQPPTYDSSKPKYWVKVTTTYDSGDPTIVTYLDNGITDAMSTAAAANSTANTANQTANTANNTANNANQTANTANNTANNANTKADQAVTNVNNLQNKLKYYWVNEVAHTNGVSGWTKPNYPAGTYAASGISGTTFDAENSSTYGYNTWYANGINLRYNAIKLGELTGSALTFYQPSITSQGAKAMELSGSALKFYASNGTTVQAEFGGSKARVSGTINAYDGQIGNSEDNYWYIGNYLDYFENQSAIIKSHGTASIQLGDSNTWRIATNRIHTAWNNDSSSGDAFKLHFPVYDNKYWDSGLHLPTSANDKLLYIRNSSSSNTLTYLNEALEDQYTNRWNYLFYITNSGSIYAKNIYVLDDNGQATQIGGTDGVYLLKSGGTITGDLTVNGTLTGTLSGTATRVSKDLKIQLNGGTTEGTNQFTYNGGTAKTINITKSSVGLSNVENTALSTWAGSSNLTTTKVGTLAAAAVKGIDTSITASSTSTNLPTSKAVADLIRGYLPLTGGNVTGAVTFGSSVSADELTAGDLVVNGAASFTNNLQANTINGVAVGSSPKFTDVNVTQTATTTSAAYEVLFSYTADNTTRTEGARKTSTFTYNPNTKELTVGTVKIKEASTGFTISGGTTSKTLTVGGDYTLAAAAAKGVVTSIDTSANLPTSNAVKTFVEGKGYITANHTSTYTLPLAASGTRGGVQIGYSANGKNYPVQLSSEKMYVNVPWENTTYTTGNGLRLSGTQFINTRIPFVAGTQTAATGSWTGVCNDIAALYDGLTIAYWLPYAGSGNATLNLTINGTATGAKNCYYSGTTRLTTHFGAGNIIYLTYRSAGNINGTNYEGWWANANYDSNDTGYYHRRIYPNIKAGSNKIYPYTLIMQLPDGRWESLVTSNSTGTSKAKNTHGFLLGHILLMYYNETYTENQSVSTYRIWSAYTGLIDHRYSFNTANDSTNGTTGYKPIYLVGSLGSDGLFYLADKWWTQTLPTTADGKIYIYIGDAYDYYRMTFTEDKPMYVYTNGKLREFSQDTATVTGHTVAKDVPSNAIFTDTWNALSTSQAGYVAKAPNDTGKFLRGDATWAAVTKSNVGLGNVTNDKQIKGLSSGTTSGHLVTWGSDGYTVADSGITKGNIVKSVGSNNSGQLVLTYADDTTSNPIDVTFVATIASSATLADALNVGGTAVGSATTPVYFDNQGKPQTANTIPKLNNTTTGGAFYAPTSAGTAKQILVSTAGTPGWQTVATGGTNGTIKIGSDEYAVKGLAAAAYKGIADSSSASAIGTGTSVTTERDVYYGLPTINNAHNYTSSTTIYAPTAGGTSSQVLIGNGTTSAPVWTDISGLVPSSATNATNATYATYDASEVNNTTKVAIADKYIPKSIGTAAGDIIYWSASGTPTRLAKGSNGQVLKLANGVPTWGTDNNDNTWRAIQVNGTDILGTGTNTNKLNLKAGTNVSLSNSSGTVTITATDVKVTQTNTTGNADYRLLFSENANDTDSTETTRKNTNLKFNPSSGLLKTYGISSAAGSTPVIYSDVSATEIKAADSSLTTSSSDSDWLKALLIALCTKYPDRGGCIFKGTMSPNSVGWYEVHIYNTSIKDSTTGLPQYSFGRFLKYINNYELFGTSSYAYSYRTVDTNTWNALSTSQAGYVSTAPNDTTKFLRGDATWAQVSSANLSDIRLTWSSSVSTTDWILAHDTAATGTPLFRAMSPTNLKTTMSLNNVENTKLSTWAGSSNITTVGTISSGTWNGSAIPVANGGTGATTAANARTNLGLGSAATYTAATSVGNNSNLPTGAAIQTYVNGVVGNYVTLGTDQTITANQKTFNGAIRWGTASKYGAAHYDSTLEAIVFSFA